MRMARLSRVWRQRIRSIAHRSQLDDDLDRELAFHLDQLIDEKIADGLSAGEARRAARRAFGNAAVVAECSREQRRVRWLDDLRQDLAYGFRVLRHNTAFATVAILSMGIGVGANVAFFAAIDRTLLQDPPLADVDRVAYVDTVSTAPGGEAGGVTVNEFLAWQSRSAVYEALEATFQRQVTIGADATGPAERLSGNSVTEGYFRLVGVRPILGRTFTDDETRLEAPVPAVVVSERLWRRRFAADPNVVGTAMRINGTAYPIVGVVPDDFRFQHESIQLWLPLRMVPQADRGGARVLRVIVRLAPGTSAVEAESELDLISGQLAATESTQDSRVRLRPIGEALLGWTRVPLFTLQAAAAAVWLAACTNLALLLFIRGLARQGEMRLRAALGAGRGRVVRQLFTEGLLIATGGAAVASGVAHVCLLGLSALRPPPANPAIGPMPTDGRLILVTLVLSLFSVIAAGVGPVYFATRVAAPAANGRARYPLNIPSWRPVGALLLIVQVAVALAVMVGAGLLASSALRLSMRRLHLEPSRALTFDVALPTDLTPLNSYRGFGYFEVGSAPAQTFARILDRLRDLPGVTSVGASSSPAINALVLPRFDVRLGRHRVDEVQGPAAGEAVYYVVTPDFFRATGTDMIRGRDVAESDTSHAPWVVVVNEAAARQFWPGKDPIGRWLSLDTVPEDQPRQVVGVVPNVPLRHDDLESQPVVYTSFRQQPARWRAPGPALFFGMTFVVRTPNDPHALLRRAQDAVARINPDLPLARADTIEAHLTMALARIRHSVRLLLALACAAVLLAAIGLYGTVAGLVGQRTKEIAIRRALGARTGHVLDLVVRRTVGIVAMGLAIGLCVAPLFARLLASQLWGIEPTDPLTYGLAALALVCVAVLATAWPSRRALRIDPAVILRDE